MLTSALHGSGRHATPRRTVRLSRLGLAREREQAVVRRTLIAVSVLAMMAASAVPVLASARPVGGTFEDDDGNVHEGFIEAIAELGITRGCNPPLNTDYCPDGLVTRGQVAAFLVRAKSLPATLEDFFVDDEGSVFEDDINRLRAAGITFGCNPPDNDRYCPGDVLTRGQMAALLVRAFMYVDPGPGDWFIDDNGSIFEGDIDRLRQAGVTLGCNPPDNDRFCPNDPVRRDQMASFLGRALGLMPMVPESPDDFLLEPDGVGSTTFGMPTDFVLLELALLGDPAVTGDPDDDTGWIDSFSIFGTCPGDEIRVVRWGTLEVFFKRDSIAEEGEFFTYRVSNFSNDRIDLKLRTAEGLRLGDTVAELQALYGSRVDITFEDVFGIWYFEIDDTALPFTGLGGTLTGGDPADLVQFIDAGERCGE
jgi:hypothetical protein